MSTWLDVNVDMAIREQDALDVSSFENVDVARCECRRSYKETTCIRSK